MKLRVKMRPDSWGELEVVAGADPQALLFYFVQRGIEWSIDWKSTMDPVEFVAWGKADLECRITRALLDGREVRFLDGIFCADDPRDMSSVLVAEDAVIAAIRTSGFMVSLGSDDESGVTITVGPPEQPPI